MVEIYLHSPYVIMAWCLIDQAHWQFYAPCVPYETTQILSEAFPDAIDNKLVIRNDNVN
jgi:hypothetical protein